MHNSDLVMPEVWISDPVPAQGHIPRPPRQRTYMSGKLVYGATDDPARRNALSLDCAIRDISEGGAKVTIVGRLPLPPDVYLLLVKHSVAYQAKIVWMKFPARGLKFLQTYMLKSELPRELRFLQRLSADLDARSGNLDLF
jgi:hypothetical protein